MQPLLQWESNDYDTTWVCVCSLRYPACNAHAPYCHLWPAPLYNIFPHYLKKARFSKKKIIYQIKYVFWFSLQLLSATFLVLRRNEWDMIRNVHWSSRKVPFIVVRFYRNLNFLHRFSKKSSIVKLHENPSGGVRVVPCVRTDRHAWRS